MIQLLALYTNPESHNAYRSVTVWSDKRTDGGHDDDNSRSYCKLENYSIDVTPDKKSSVPVNYILAAAFAGPPGRHAPIMGREVRAESKRRNLPIELGEVMRKRNNMHYLRSITGIADAVEEINTRA